MSNVTRMPNVSPQNWPQQNWLGSWPPTCGCGCNPCQCGGGWGGLMQCWQDIAQFQQFLICMLSQAGPFPLQGITDGSNAKAGNIGEYITMVGTMAYAAYPAVTTGTISAGVLPPGDWNITSAMTASAQIGEVSFYLSPEPAGMSNAMLGVAGITTYGAGSTQTLSLIGQNARGNFTVPTLLPFAVAVYNNTGSTLVAGTVTLTVEARRMR